MGKDKTDETFKSEYDHLNEDSAPVHGMTSGPVPIFFDWDALADIIVAQNYGTVRILAALVRARLRSQKFNEREYPDELSLALQKIIKDGLH